MIHRIVGTTIVGLFAAASMFLLGACQLGRGGQSPPVSKTYLLTLRPDDFTVIEAEPTTVARAAYKVDITATDVRDAVITAQLQFPTAEGAWEPFPYTVNGFVPGSDPKRAASLTLTYQVQEGRVQLMATGSLTGPEMQLSFILFNGFKIRIRVVPTTAQ